MKVDMGLRLHYTLLSSLDIVGHFILDRHLRRDAFVSVAHPGVCAMGEIETDEPWWREVH
jgi:hypothetical protein